MIKLKKIFVLVFSLFIFNNAYSNSIPFDYIDGKMIVSVEIMNKTHNFIFDSGALTLISDKIVDINAYKSNVKFDSKDANNTSDIKEVFILKSLKIGNVKVSNINFSKINTDWLSKRACVRIDGVLGANALVGNIWKIDFQKKLILINEGIEPQNITIPFKQQPFTKVPIVSGNIRGKNIEFVIDTGSNNSISLKKSIYDEIKDETVLKSEGYISQSINSNSIGIKETDIMIFKLDSINLGNQIIDSDNFTINLIGTKFLENFLLTLDFVNNRIILQKQNKDISFYSFGFALAPINNKLQIVNIYKTKSTSSLKLSEIISKVDDVDTRNINDDTICKVLQKLRNSYAIEMTKENGTKIKVNKINLVEKL